MVLIHIKKSDHDQFLVETSREVETTAIIEEIVDSISYLVSNLRLRVDKACGFVEELTKYGPLKDEEKRGLTEGEEDIPCPIPGHIRVIDPNHYRIGWCVTEDLGRRIFETTQSARALIHKSNADRRIPINVKQLREAIMLMKGAVNMAYPAYHGLPNWEPAVLALENEDFREVLSGEEFFEKNALLWFAGKEIQRGKHVGFYVKGSENTKIIAKITKFGAGAPVREPAIDTETQKQMIAWHHKKEEEAKKVMAVDDGDQYLNSPWANPRGLKNQMHGAGDIRYRPLG